MRLFVLKVVLLVVLLLAMAPVFAGQEVKAGIQKAAFGKLPDGTAVDIYTLTNDNGVSAKIMTYGAIVTELHVPDKDGKLGDVVLGFDNLDAYVKGHPYFGAIVGRVANRIAKGKFSLDGKEYTLAINNPPNTLHGGVKGFDKVVWAATPMKAKDGPALKLMYTSPDGEEGYPGALKVTVIYTLTNKNALRVDYTATTDKATPLNLSNHSYFNLTGHGDVLNHEVTFFADRYVPVDENLIPTGELKPVVGTPFDFTSSHPVWSQIKEIGNTPNGYDHTYVLNHEGSSLVRAARTYDPASGRVLEMWTTEPGFQFYTGNFLDGTLTGKGGFVYTIHTGFCLEAQHFPDSINHPSFPNTVLKPGQTYKQRTEYIFSTQR